MIREPCRHLARRGISEGRGIAPLSPGGLHFDSQSTGLRQNRHHVTEKTSCPGVLSVLTLRQSVNRFFHRTRHPDKARLPMATRTGILVPTKQSDQSLGFGAFPILSGFKLSLTFTLVRFVA